MIGAHGSKLRSHLVWNSISFAVPILFAFVSIPILVRNIGYDRFGVLTIIWAVAGYFGVFDFGLSKSLSHAMIVLGGAERKARSDIVVTGLAALAGLGLIVGAIFFVFSGGITDLLVGAGNAIHGESVSAFRLIALSLPFIILFSGVRGIIESEKRFVLSSISRTAIAALTYFGPTAISVIESDLVHIAAVILAIRIASFAVYALVLVRSDTVSLRLGAVSLTILKKLFSTGGWMSVSNIVIPLTVYSDRFFISYLAGVTAVSFYAVPFEIIMRVTTIPVAFGGVMFVYFSESYARRDGHLSALYRKGMQYVLLFCVPTGLVLAVFSRTILGLWISDDFAQNAHLSLSILALGLPFYGLIQPSFNMVQACGRSDLAAKLHVAETIAYLIYMSILLKSFGVPGAAAAWSGRLLLSSVLHHLIARHLMARHHSRPADAALPAVAAPAQGGGG